MGCVDMLLRGLRAAQVVENPVCSPHGTARRNHCLGGGVDYGCDLGVTDVSLDGCLSADPVSVAGVVGAGGRDRGKRPFSQQVRRGRGGAYLLGGDTTDVHCANGAADGGARALATPGRSTSVPCGMTDSGVYPRSIYGLRTAAAELA